LINVLFPTVPFIWHDVLIHEENISRHIKKQKPQCEVAEDASEPDMALSQSKLFLKL
jgi:hypothetical protein